MNSKDLQGIDCIPDYFKYTVDAIKIEGRMKSALYVANAVQQYRFAIDTFASHPDDFYQQLPTWQNNLGQVSNRGFTDASLTKPASKSSISYEWNGYNNSVQFMGVKVQRIQVVNSGKKSIKKASKLYAISPHESSQVISDLSCMIYLESVIYCNQMIVDGSI